METEVGVKVTVKMSMESFSVTTLFHQRARPRRAKTHSWWLALPLSAKASLRVRQDLTREQADLHADTQAIARKLLR